MKTGVVRTRIRKGDLVRIICGREAGKQGPVLAISLKTQRAVVEGLNLVKRATKPTQTNPKGGLMEREGKIHLSNLMLVCGGCQKATRVGYKMLPDGKKLRSCKRCGEVMDKA